MLLSLFNLRRMYFGPAKGSQFEVPLNVPFAVQPVARMDRSVVHHALYKFTRFSQYEKMYMR